MSMVKDGHEAMKCNVDEKKAIENLFRCSKRAEKQEKAISIKDWDAVSNWTQTIPMCCYSNDVSHKKERKKGSSKRNQNYQNAKARTYSGINSKTDKRHQQLSKKINTTKEYFTKDKCKHYELPLLKESLPDDYSKNPNPLIRNKFSRSTNVLSYETPSWRFLLDNNDFKYIERTTPKEKIYNFLKRSKSSYTKSKGTPSKPKQILDPAGFLDEQMYVAYKSYKNFKPNQSIRQLLSKIDNINSQHPQQQQNDIHDRLYLTSFIKRIPNNGEEGESDGNEDYNLHLSPNNIVDRNQSNKKNNKTARSKKKRKASLKKPTVMKKNFVLPEIVPKQSTLKALKSDIQKSNLCFSGNEELKSKRVEFSTEELYLPLLNHSNYTSKLQYLKRPEVKLPAVAGIKISLSATSNSGLVL